MNPFFHHHVYIVKLKVAHKMDAILVTKIYEMETCEMIDLDFYENENSRALVSLMNHPGYILLEYNQANSLSNRLFISDTIEGETFMVLAMAN